MPWAPSYGTSLNNDLSISDDVDELLNASSINSSILAGSELPMYALTFLITFPP